MKYYCHDTNMRSNIKISILRKRMGMHGYGAWCFMLELLAGSDGYLKWNDDIAALYQEELGFTDDQMNEFIGFCTKQRMLEIDEESGTISCPGLIERTSEYAAKAEQIREADERKRDELSQVRSEAGKKGLAKRWGNNANSEESDSKTIANDSNGIANDSNGIANDSNGIANDSKTIANDSNGIANDSNGIANDSIKNKNKNIYNDDDNPCVRTHERERAEVPEQLRREVEQLATDAMWLDAIAMQNKLTAAQVKARLPDFVTSCIAQGRVTHDSGRDLKSHFANWLRIRIAAEKNQIHNATTPTTTNRSPNSPDAVARRMAEYEALDAYLASH